MMAAFVANRMDHHRHPSLLVLAATVALAGTWLPVQAQPNLRSTFPGRRVGGATRGECSARLIAHMVPSNSVFAPGDTGLVGILQGPTANPRPIQVTFKSEGGTGSSSSQVINLPASGEGIVLIHAPKLTGPTRWESTFVCEDASATANDDPLAFVTAGSPPPLTLLLNEASPDDTLLQKALLKLRKACGGSVPRSEVASSFALADVLKDGWPAQLPVSCPG